MNSLGDFKRKMGGNTFEETKRLTNEEYSIFIERLRSLGFIEGIDFLIPFRLGNKESHSDIDLIVHDADNIISKLEDVKEIKTISLFEERFGLYSKHILLDNLTQIDFLISWNSKSLEITRAFFSYSIANIFLKRMITFVDRNAKLSYLGLFISDRNFRLDGLSEESIITIDNNSRLVIDCNFIFNLLDLNYIRYTEGFNDESELLTYLSTSKYYHLVEFKNNSKFKHDFKRLEPFRRCIELGLITVR